jgi:lipopolysaccharide export LptBFGC system permease protein LptF
MKLSEIVIKIIGLVLAIVGLALILSAVGVNFLGIGLSPVWLAVLVGVILLGAGIYIIRGGNISL